MRAGLQGCQHALGVQFDGCLEPVGPGGDADAGAGLLEHPAQPHHLGTQVVDRVGLVGEQQREPVGGEPVPVPRQQGEDLGVPGADLHRAAGAVEPTVVTAEHRQPDRARPRRSGRRRRSEESGHLGWVRGHAQPLNAQFRFQGRDGRLHERESLRGHRLVAARDVDDAEDGAGMRVGDAHGRATPRMRQLVEILGPLNLDSVIEGQGRARRARADPALGPVRPLDEQHPLRLTPHGSVTVDPERAAELVTDGHDQAGVKGVPDKQVVHDREHGGKRMPVAQLA